MVVVALLVAMFQEAGPFAPKPYVLARSELAVYASRAELADREIHVSMDGRVRYEFSDRRSDAVMPRKGTTRLSARDLADLKKFLLPASWKTLLVDPRKDVMWPSAYDAMDRVIWARIGKRVERWGNDRYAGGQEAPLVKLFDRLIRTVESQPDLR